LFPAVIDGTTHLADSVQLSSRISLGAKKLMNQIATLMDVHLHGTNLTNSRRNGPRLRAERDLTQFLKNS
jgi:hypothetical protein